MKKIFNHHYKIILFILLESILFSSLPLTNIFSYEFSIAQGIVLSFVFGLLTIKMFPFDKRNKEINVINLVFLYALLFIIPIIVSIISTRLNQNCPLTEGFQFYLVITLPAVIFGISLGMLSVSFFNRWNKIIFCLFWFSTILFPVVEIYYNPQIYIYNPVLGFFPGTIYDEDISISAGLLFYKAIITIFSILFIFISVKVYNVEKIKKKTVFAVIVLLTAGFLLLKPKLGFSSTLSSIKSELKGELITRHFDIIYSSKIHEKVIKNIGLHHEYYYKDLSSALKDSITGRITSFVFNDKYEKRKLFGAGNADVAKPWLKQIYATREHFDSTLKHELAHVFSSNYGWSIFKVAKYFNPAMIEGFAMALQNNFGNSGIDYVTAGAVKNGMKINISKLFSGFNFFDQNTSISYVYAGSFIKYLMNNYSTEQVKKVYSDLDFKLHFNKNLIQLSKEFYVYLKSLRVVQSKNKGQLYFKRKPIQSRVCVRYTANKLNDAWKLFNSGAFYSAQNMFAKIYKYSGAYSALFGEVSSLKAGHQYKNALKLLDQNKEKFEGTAYIYNLLFNIGDLQIINNKLNSADSTFSLLKKMRPSIEYINLSSLRLFLLNDDSVKVKSYILGSVFDKFNILKNVDFSKVKFNIIPIMITLSSELKQNYSSFIQKYIKISFDSSFSSAYSALELSKYAKDNDDFKTAVYFGRKALLLNGNLGFRKILEENLKKDLWMNRNYLSYYKKMYFKNAR